MISKQQRGSLYAILSGFLYGFIGYFGISVLHSSISVTNMLFWRFFIASLLIGVFLLNKFKSGNHSRKDMLLVFLNGAVFYSVSTILYFLACHYIGSGLAMVLFFTYPAMIMLLNYFLYGQRMSTIYYCAIVIIMAGMPLFVDIHEMRFDFFGIILSILSALLYAAYIISSKKMATLSPDIATLMVCLGCTVSCLIFSLINHSFTIPTTLPVWINLLGISIISTSLPILLFLYSLNYISAEKAAILSVLEPIFVLIFGVTLLDEPMKLQYVLGAIIVLAGALITLTGPRRNLRLHASIEQGSVEVDN